MSDWNEAKLETLEDAYASGEISSSDLADSRGVTLHAASNRLKRYHRQGLFRREKNGKKYFYNITGKGIERINWLRENKVTKELFQTIAAKMCPVKKAKNVTSIVEQKQNYSDSNLAPETRIFKNYTDKRCPVVRPRNQNTQDSVELDEEDYEEEYDDPETYDLDQEDELDENSYLFNNIQRCKVIREENDPVLTEDSEEEETVEEMFKRLSQQRCRINDDDID